MLQFVVFIAFISSPNILCTAKSPNIVLFLLDDQDILINGMTALPKALDIFKTNGIYFQNAFASTPVCCVSRGSILTGRYVHNSQIFNNSIFGGCGSKAYIKNDEPYSYASYLNKKGNYRTFFSGKYLNLYGRTDQMPYTHVPQGWTDWYGLIGDAVYYNYRLSINGERHEYHGDDGDNDYLPFVMHEKAKSFLQDIVDTNDERPFLISLAFPSGHSPWTPPNDYMYVLNDETLTTPQVDNFNYFNSDGTNNDKGPVLRFQKKMNAEEIEMADKVYRGRHGTFMAVDDIIYDLYQQITEMDEIDNTYWIYASDHGFHIGQYGMWFGKKLLYDTDLRIPFFIHGPSISPNTVTSKIALTLDIAPTIVDLAIGEVPDTMDGESLVPYLNLSEQDELEILNSRQEFLIEYYGETDIHHDTGPLSERLIYCPAHMEAVDDIACDSWNNTFQCIRTIDGSKLMSSMNNDNIGQIFCQYTCFNDQYEQIDCKEATPESRGEYYNLNKDPWQLTNTFDQLSQTEISVYQDILDKHLQCNDKDCRKMRTRYKEEDKMKQLLPNFINKEKNNLIMIVTIICGIFIILSIWAFIYFVVYKSYKSRNDKYDYDYSPLQRITRYNAM